MSTKNSLKDKIKKPNATQTFFNQYTDNKAINEEINEVRTENNSNKEEKDNINNNIYVNNNDETNNNETIINNDVSVSQNTENPISDEVDDYLRGLALGQKPKKKKAKKVFTSFYMDADLAEKVEKIVKNGEKGDKSKLINAGIRKLLKEYGVI